MANHISNGLRFFEAVTICVFILVGFFIVIASAMMKYDKRKDMRASRHKAEILKSDTSKEKVQRIH